MTTTLRALLVGPRGHGGEGVYMERLRDHPPQGVQYDFAGDHHQGAAGAPCQVGHEVLLNQIVHRLAAPDMGFRALRLRERFDLVHVHAHPVRLRDLDGAPLIMSEGSSSGIYLRDYVGWGEARLARAFARTRTLYRLCGVADRLHALHRATLAYVFSDWARTANLRWGADPEKLRVLYPGFADPGPRPTIDRDTFTFLFVGRDFERKGGFELLEAMRVLSRDHPHVRLLLAGSDPSEHNPVRSWVSDSKTQARLGSGSGSRTERIPRAATVDPPRSPRRRLACGGRVRDAHARGGVRIHQGGGDVLRPTGHHLDGGACHGARRVGTHRDARRGGGWGRNPGCDVVPGRGSAECRADG